MVVAGFLRLSGFFTRLTHAGSWIASDRRISLLAMVIPLSGVLSAFLVNDILCVALTPIVLQLAKKLGYKPVPHVIALATAANIGACGSITGNPQNMFIGAHSQIPYATFALHLMPVAIIGLVIDFLVIVVLFHRDLSRPAESRADFGELSRSLSPSPDGPEDGPTFDNRRDMRVLQWKSAIVTLLAMALFFTGLPIALVAVGAAAVLLISRVKPAMIYKEIDWSLLLMFVGLFIVVHTFQMHVVSRWDVGHWQILLSHPVDVLSIASAGLSNLVSNVPAVLLFEPVMHAMPPATQQTAWLALAMSSTLAGNLTLLGSVANLIVVEIARREGVEVSFGEYCKAGIPVTICTLAVGVGWLMFVKY